jgi:hypothetical protein
LSLMFHLISCQRWVGAGSSDATDFLRACSLHHLCCNPSNTYYAYICAPH